MSEIERDLMDDIKYRILRHQKKYGINTIEDTQHTFDLTEMERICIDLNQNVENCFNNNNNNSNIENNNELMPYYDNRFNALNCANEMDKYKDCIDRRARALHA